MKGIRLDGVPVPCRFKPDRKMSEAEFSRFTESQEILWVERDAKGWVRVQHIHGHKAGAAAMHFIVALHKYDSDNDLGCAYAGVGCVLPDGSILGPNVAWVSHSRLNSQSNWSSEDFLHLSPDFVIEISSPFRRLSELKKKMGCWIANGALLALLVDVERRSVTVYQPDQTPRLIEQPILIELGPPVAGLQVNMNELWQDLDKTFRSK